MKHIKPLILAAAFLLAACGGDDDATGGSDKPTNPTTTEANTNANDASVNPYTARLEFPQVKRSGTRILVNSTTDYGVNYCVEWDVAKKSQRYSCYQMYAGNSVSKTTRYVAGDDELQYPFDERLNDVYFGYDPFWRTGYDHGHICPSADRLCSKVANIQTFYLSNMQPQVNGFNAGVWEHMESRLRNWNVNNFRDTLYVCKGGTIEPTASCPDAVYTTLGSGLIVPQYFFMAILCKNSQGYKALGFWVEHKANNDSSLAKYVVNIDYLERMTGIDFFCNLPDKVEETVESMDVESIKSAWNLK